MKDFIDLSIMGILGYLAVKFSLSYITSKVKWWFTDKEKYAEQSRMRYENTIYARDFKREEHGLIRRGFSTEGIYIFTNRNNNRKYVGQSIDLIRRLNEHLKGRGNGDLYNDMMMGDEFTIRLIKLSETNFSNLNQLEKHYISRENSYYAGYNKTKGNN